MQRSNLSYESFLSSDAFHVKGPSGKSYFAHSALLAQRSKVLDKAINGSMREAEERQISLIDVDGDFDDATVMRFIEFAYTGSYTTPEPSEPLQPDTVKSSSATTAKTAPVDKPKSDLNTDPPFALLASNSIFAAQPPSASTTTASAATPMQVNSAPGTNASVASIFATSTTPKTTTSIFGQQSALPILPKTPAQKTQSLWSAFTFGAHAIRPDAWEPRVLKHGETLTTDLICHAQLYVFANRYECPDLTRLTLQRLRLTLTRVDHTRSPPSVIELLDYTYTHTHEHTFVREPLRSLLIDYTVCHLEKFAGIQKFKELLRQEGAFADDLLTKTMARLDV